MPHPETLQSIKSKFDKPQKIDTNKNEYFDSNPQLYTTQTSADYGQY